MIRGLLQDFETKNYFIRDLEVSIGNVCNLQCKECGFNIPNQRKPFITDPIKEIYNSLKILENLNIYIHRFPILGGEPTLYPNLLLKAVNQFRFLTNIQIYEVVTNGLNPKGLKLETLKNFDEISISVYFNNPVLLQLWEKWLNLIAPKIKLNIRYNLEKWDQNSGNYSVSKERAQKMFEECWYRKHCVTIERERLFACSRLAKFGDDEEDGLLLNEDTTFNDIERYLNRTNFLPSCRNCTPRMGFKKLDGGIQKNPDNFSSLQSIACNFLENELKSLENHKYFNIGK